MLRLRQLVRVAAALGWLAHRWFLMGWGEGERDTRAAAGDTLGQQSAGASCTVSVRYLERGGRGDLLLDLGMGEGDRDTLKTTQYSQSRNL